ncbi:MAG: hypothetical protein WCH04_15560 [Gammaproteobacteria bacterium]
MNIIYDMASGRTESPSTGNNIATVPDEPIPLLAVRELSSSETGRPLAAFSIHLVHALLRKG